MHSGFILLLWLVAVATLQLLSPTALAVALAVCALAALALARARTGQLIRRVRVLLLAITILFAWFTPGEAALLDWPRLGPTRDGLALAAVHAARLLAVVCAVGILLECLPSARLVGGLYALARPLRLFGLAPERLALRLLLVLRYVESSPRGSGPVDWKRWLADERAADVGAPVVLHREPLGVAEVVLACVLFAALLWWSLK
jgi:energy-coupling factor transporter transmembrane protein EcfT